VCKKIKCVVISYDVCCKFSASELWQPAIARGCCSCSYTLGSHYRHRRNHGPKSGGTKRGPKLESQRAESGGGPHQLGGLGEQLWYIQLIIDKTNAADLSRGVASDELFRVLKTLILFKSSSALARFEIVKSG